MHALRADCKVGEREAFQRVQNERSGLQAKDREMVTARGTCDGGMNAPPLLL